LSILFLKKVEKVEKVIVLQQKTTLILH